MSEQKTPNISSRKKPKQARSSNLVASILEAAARVLATEGASRFTTARVAEKAGVSVGSVYQYFPNKAAILFRLQIDEWQQTAAMLRDILEDPAHTPLERLRMLVVSFIHSECDEAQTRVALNDSAPLYRDAPEAKEARAAGDRTIDTFMHEILPQVPDATRAMAGDLIMTTLTTAGKEFSETPRTPAEIAAYGGAMADMFCAYIERLQASGR